MMFSVKAMRFGSEGENLLFQTHRLNVYQKGNLENQEVGLGDLATLGRGIYGVFQDTFSPEVAETAKPSREVGNLRIELGGKGDFNIPKAKENLKGFINYFLTIGKETVAVFVKKLWAMVSGAQDKFAAFGKVVSGLVPGMKSGQSPEAPGASA